MEIRYDTRGRIFYQTGKYILYQLAKPIVIYASFSVTMNFFGILRAIYVFFSTSPWGWSKLLQNMEENIGVVKPLSDSRWSA
jgi:hypothetical protein